MRAIPAVETLKPAAQACIVQVSAAAIALVPVLAGLEVSLAQWALVQGAIAMRIATLTGAAPWWPPLHLLFVPGIVWAHTLSLEPAWWAVGFAALAMVFGGVGRTQVPLFLTARRVRARLAALLAQERSVRFIDLGCGLGTVIAALKRMRPDCEFHGVELAPLPFLISRILAGRAGCRVERRDIMTTDLAAFDVVYAFLSPAPMRELWVKVRREMRPGSLFVSLAFRVPGAEPQQVIRVSGRPRDTLYVWRM
jgi:SAM-dependent methyltransferase